MVDRSINQIQESCKQKDEITYEKLKAEYIINGKTELLERMIHQILSKMVTSSKKENYLTQKIFIRIINNLMLNEFELALWAIFLDKFLLGKDLKNSKKLLLFSAFKAKSELVDNMQPIFSFVSQTNSEFKAKYVKWTLKNKKYLEYTPSEINDKFTLLTNANSVDEVWPNNFNKKHAARELHSCSNIETFLSNQDYFDKKKIEKCQMKEDLSYVIVLKRRKWEHEIETNESEEEEEGGEKYIEIGGKIVIIEDNARRKRDHSIEKLSFIDQSQQKSHKNT